MSDNYTSGSSVEDADWEKLIQELLIKYDEAWKRLADGE